MLMKQKMLVGMMLLALQVHAFRKKASQDTDVKQHTVGDDIEITEVTPVTPLCNEEIVEETCALFREDGSEFKNALELVTEQMKASADDADAFFQKIEADESTHCVDLCSKALAYARKESLIIPEEHDKGCIKIGGGWTCNIDLSLKHIADEERIALASDEDPDHRGSEDGESSVRLVPDPASLAQVQEQGIVLSRTVLAAPPTPPSEHTSFASMGATAGSDTVGAAVREATTKNTVDQDPIRMATKTLGLFRIYVKRGDDDKRVIIDEDALSSLVDLNGTAETADAAQTAVQTAQTQAQAWVTTILRLLNAGQARQYRQKWFGSSGSLSESAVKEHLVKTFNFMDKELADMYFFYPGDHASNSGCSRSGSGGTLAYVWKYVRNERGYHETTGPRCGQATEARTKQCAVDANGNFIVYLCKFWYDSFGESDRIATVVHEAAHHTGPSDITYSKTQAQQLPQSDQLHNAANYQRFGEDVTVAGGGGSSSPRRRRASVPRRRRASSSSPRRRRTSGGSGCADSATVSGFECKQNGVVVSCTCDILKSHCSNSQVKSACPATCNECSSSPGSGSDTCQYANDGACDEPQYCRAGTDCTDCGNCGGSSPPRRRATPAPTAPRRRRTTPAPTEAPRRRYVAPPRRRYVSPPRRRSYVSPYRRRRSSSSSSSGSCSSWCKESYCSLGIEQCTGCTFCR